MAVAFDSSSTQTGSTANFNVSHITSGNNRYLLVVTASQSSAASAVSYAGQAMTNIMSFVNCNVWGLMNPASGTNNISVTVSQGSFTTVAVGCSWNGVAQIGQPESASSTDTGGAAVTVSNSVTTLTDKAWVIGVCQYQSASGQPTAGTGETQRFNSGGSGTYYPYHIVDSNAPKTPAGAYSMTTNVSASSGRLILWTASLAEALPVSGGNATLMGV